MLEGLKPRESPTSKSVLRGKNSAEPLWSGRKLGSAERSDDRNLHNPTNKKTKDLPQPMPAGCKALRRDREDAVRSAPHEHAYLTLGNRPRFRLIFPRAQIRDVATSTPPVFRAQTTAVVWR